MLEAQRCLVIRRYRAVLGKPSCGGELVVSGLRNITEVIPEVVTERKMGRTVYK